MEEQKKDVVSVIVPIYNVEDDLMECVRSIQNQTYSSLQIILVDDGSPDGCGDICDSLAKDDCRITVIHTIIGTLFTLIPSLCEQLKDKVYLFDRIQTAYFDVFLTELNFLWWGAYFLIGIVLAIRGANFINLFARHRKLYFVISYCIYIFVYFMCGKNIVLQSMKLLVSVILFITILNLRLSINSEISINLRKMSTIIYFSHFTFIYIVQIVFKFIGLEYGTHLTLAWIICCAAVVFYSFLVVYMKGNTLMRLYERK